MFLDDTTGRNRIQNYVGNYLCLKSVKTLPPKIVLRAAFVYKIVVLWEQICAAQIKFPFCECLIRRNMLLILH